MTLYLQLDGVDDYLQLPSMTLDRIVIDFKPGNLTKSVEYILGDNRSGYIRNNGSTGNEEKVNYSFTVGGISSTGTNNLILPNTRITLDATRASNTPTVKIGSDTSGLNNLNGSIYTITVYSVGAIQARYDMSTGTVQDQSGNGKHAMLNGGTWLDDGTGGSTGTDGTTTFDVKQSIYSDSSLNVDTEQALYQDSSLAVDSKQFIYSDSFVTHDSKQVLFNDSFTIFDTLQEFFSDGIVGSIPFDMRFILYSDNSIQIDNKQAFYTEGMFQSDLLQLLKEPTKPVISEIHLFGSSNASTHLTGKNVAPINIRTKKTASIHLKGGIQ